MKNLKKSAAAKVTAVILASLLMLCAVSSFFAVAVLYFEQGYMKQPEEFVSDMVDRYLDTLSLEIISGGFSYYEDSAGKIIREEYYSSLDDLFEYTNIYYRITLELEDGEKEYSNIDALKETGSVSAYKSVFEKDGVKIELFVSSVFSRNDNVRTLISVSKLCAELRYFLIVSGCVSTALYIALMIFAVSAAGHTVRRRGAETGAANETEGKYSLSLFDRIPLDILTAASITISALIIAAADASFSYYHYFHNVYYGATSYNMRLLAFSIATLLLSLIVNVFIVTLSSRIKNRTVIKNNLISHALRFVGRVLRGAVRLVSRGASNIISGIPFFWKALLIILAVFFFELISMILISHEAVMIVFYLIIWAFIIFAACHTAYRMNLLKEGGERLAAGDFDHKIDTRHMPRDFKEHAENLNNVGVGMVLAVEERMKSERFKTELITNVSHDIKTPLTSIINYVDLLKKERIEGDAAREYIEVLDRQSLRLKKLTEDLVEASAAATGVLKCEPVPCELCVLLTQAVGEYEDKFSKNGLVPVVIKPEEPVTIMADGRHLWRIFDNLMNNACKYALTGTRVYIELKREGSDVMIAFKNISREELNISGEELMERFVRGDSSRHTEGSGLGLSIARSLAELSGGTLRIYIDGDLYKAVLNFKAIN